MKADVERFGYNKLLQDFKDHNKFINTFHEYKVLKKVIIIETFYMDFQNKLIKFGLFFYYFHSHTHTYTWL